MATPLNINRGYDRRSTDSRELKFARGMAAENDALLSAEKPPTYTGFQDSSTSLGYIVKNTSASGRNRYLLKVDGYVTKALHPWKALVRTLNARDVLAEFVGTFVLVVSEPACLSMRRRYSCDHTVPLRNTYCSV